MDALEGMIYLKLLPSVMNSLWILIPSFYIMTPAFAFLKKVEK